MANSFRSGSVSEQQVQVWRTLVIGIRKQAWAAFDYLSLQELSLLLFSILLGTVSVFLAAFNGYGDLIFNTGKVNATIVTLLLGRLFCKAYMAELVTHAVSRRNYFQRDLTKLLYSSKQLLMKVIGF